MLSHVDERGRARMVDVAGKPETARSATAEGAVRMSREAFEMVRDQAVAKGDVLGIAEVAGVMAAKRTGELILALSSAPSTCVTVESGTGRGTAGYKDHGDGSGDRPDRSRNGGVDRRLGRLPDRL